MDMLDNNKPEDTAKKEPKNGKAVATAKKSEPIVYIGPAIYRTVMPGSVFLHGYTTALKKAAEKEPAISELLVPVSEVVKARNMLRDESSAMSACYRAAEAFNRAQNRKEEN